MPQGASRPGGPHTKRPLAIGAAGLLGLLVFSAALAAHDRVATSVTWDREISRIVQARCVSCHVEGGRAPMPLGTYEQARPWARAIRDEVLARRMPVWHAARGYGDFANDPSLSPFEVALIAAWADGGAPRSTPGTGRRAARDAERKVRQRPAADPEPGRPITLPCGEQPLTGTLLAVRPILARGASAAITAYLPGGRHEIVAWIRQYNPGFSTTYRLRTPLELPAGSRLTVTPTAGQCSVIATVR